MVIEECTPIQRALLLHGRAVGSENVVVRCNRFDKCPDEIFEERQSASRGFSPSAYPLSPKVSVDWRRCSRRTSSMSPPPRGHSKNCHQDSFFESALSISHGKHAPLRYPWKAVAIASITNSYLMHRWFFYHDRLQLSTVYPAFFT